VIEKPDFFSADFDAVEVNNAGSVTDNLAFYLDAVNHGLVATPVGVSDAHTHTSGRPGLNATFIAIGTDQPSDYTDDALIEAMRARGTVPTRGPFIELSLMPGSEVTGAQTIDATVHSPSWIVVDRLLLLRDGVEVDRVDGVEATFELDPDSDASFVVIAEGDTAMAPVWPGQRPWAMTSPILIDVAGDGWTAPSGAY
jgi:hypothetical protein